MKFEESVIQRLEKKSKIISVYVWLVVCLCVSVLACVFACICVCLRLGREKEWRVCVCMCLCICERQKTFGAAIFFKRQNLTMPFFRMINSRNIQNYDIFLVKLETERIYKRNLFLN